MYVFPHFNMHVLPHFNMHVFPHFNMHVLQIYFSHPIFTPFQIYLKPFAIFSQACPNIFQTDD